MTPKQIAKYFGVTRRTVYRWIERGCPTEELTDGSEVVKHNMNLTHVTLWRKGQWTEE